MFHTDLVNAILRNDIYGVIYTSAIVPLLLPARFMLSAVTEVYVICRNGTIRHSLPTLTDVEPRGYCKANGMRSAASMLTTVGP